VLSEFKKPSAGPWSRPSFRHRVTRTARLGSLLFWTAVGLGAVAPSRLFAAGLAIPTTVASAGRPVALTVKYRPQGAAVAALQFDLIYDPAVISVPPLFGWHIGNAAADACKTVESNNLAEGTIRFTVYGNENVIGKGSIVDLIITIQAAEPGPYQIELANAFGTSSDGELVPMKVWAGKVIVPDDPVDFGLISIGALCTDLITTTTARNDAERELVERFRTLDPKPRTQLPAYSRRYRPERASSRV
jgi:Cohesin domain